MAAPSKQSSRWGSFISQAVAGVEARLDNILADGEDGSGQPRDPKLAPASGPAAPAKQSPGPSRTASSSRTNDRLQERLARAMAAKAAAQNAAPKPPDSPAARTSISSQASPRQSIDAPSRASTESLDRPSPITKEAAKEISSARASEEIARKSQVTPAIEASQTRGSADREDRAQEGLPVEANGAQTLPELLVPITTPPESAPVMEMRIEPTPELEPQPDSNEDGEEERVKDEATPAEDAQLQHQEEVHGYVERIDALEAKLHFLAREATDSARKAALAAPPSSFEKKLAEKDQQIAQLMEEGKSLASTEQKHRTIMKRLRLKIADDEKELNSLKAVKEKSDKETENLRRQVRRVDELEKLNDDMQKRLDQTLRELGALRPEIRSKDSIIAELKTQLQKASEQAEAMTAKVNDQARDQDRRKIADLEEAVAALQVEKNLVADRARIQANDLREKAERANERARALELELKAEAQVMESKLEAMRIRAEEASSGAIGDSQAKLLRQVETLQTQYSIASENWQGIEATLLARIGSLEKERDDALQRESDMRRKAREAAIRAKRQEEELEETKTKLPNIQEDVKSYQAQLDSLKRRAEEAEAALAKSRVELEKQKQAWEADKEDRQLRQPAERRSWLEDLPGGSFLKSDSRPESPQLPTPQRTFSTDFLGIQSLTSKAVRKASAPSSNSDAGAGGGESRSFSRRPSAQPLTRPLMAQSGSGGVFSPITDSLHTTPAMGYPPDREPLHREDTFDSMETSSTSAHQVLQDMMSVSTVAAGPSVQLVERMSAAIRRLESEKVAAREELARISKQRDEARAEIVALMREAQGGREALKRVADLEAEVAEVNARYETTLEMLGEKSELVDELRADVQDVKAMYRDLVERTIK
ncbi:TATA element modulatory factor 1 TATA binding-domain-containing protein [Lasiosphaeria miniovina]|uniref:TATA element modulatory factor 1 TATA binding-domain-containing protein n=1 Tax=Lasiosphaeria miniovina TaxID=1954250 RepID=A0AA40BG34_9PEZI|nr:TATA element modulatory factor 1 TATA binding-domain-containing protein [Lasiosphaeria miniovina]KAK0733606.1 TATA element modulatory factor 1 TATA binding-domain-containing protein [Lasiosphaeria miniovina]